MKAIAAHPQPGAAKPAVGQLLRSWRARRRLSQLDLAVEADISQRHLSFIESGRARPSREMLLHVAEHLEVPLRERNALLHAAGFAPVFRERALDDPELAAARQMIDRVLKAHEPNPALLVDRYWNLVTANSASGFLMKLVMDPALLAPPVNMLRLSLHPAGFAPVIVNFGAVRSHILERLRRLIDVTAEPYLTTLLTELNSYPATNAHSGSAPTDAAAHADDGSVALPLRLKVGDIALSFISTITVFGSPLDITLAELALETFFPEDAATAAALAHL